ncbi:alcohol dehydrogenase [Mesobacillus campisalis]|uniref:Alcohol dehydrogenase n=1 Tax=Mesobacillus campisalis TaxID=1408103 RepID=A0A0M2SS67_9BACI|nr:iron-containing alcohol dehydrogenase [Mesobacillus campisalis]KKK37414.1 alcohol dehydrogenase [Mesobacillus campisalis]
MDNFAVLRSPQSIFYGRNAFVNTGAEAAKLGKKALIVSDSIMDSLGYVRACRELLERDGMDCAVYLGVDTEPTDRHVAESLGLLKREACDMVISLGGGSCMDTAKAIAVIATNGGYIGDYMQHKKIASEPSLPHIAIPTTGGTGSEATDATIITNTTNDVKMMIKQAAFMPAAAIVDPLLTLSTPPNVTAATGVDALSHAIEAYISRRAHPMTDTLALSAMKLIIGNLLTAYQDGKNEEARGAMSLGSLQAGMAFSNASVCLVHGMSRPIGALFHVPHGISNAMLLPAVLEFSQEACTNRLADIGRMFQPENESLSNVEGADLAVQSIKELCLQLKIPNLKGWGIDQEAFKLAVNKMATDAIDSGSPGNNPRVPTHEELVELYHVCYEYQFTTQATV